MAAEQVSTRRGEGIYAYETRQGTRYYFKYRKSDGRSATKRGFTSVRAARRERVVVSAALGERLSGSETFGEFFDAWLRNRRPYLEAGTHADYGVHGRKRLAPLRPVKLTKLGHASITTTEGCYGHLEATFLKGAAAETEAAIWGPPPAR